MRVPLGAAMLAVAVAWAAPSAQDGRPLPDPDSFFDAVRRNLTNAEREDFRYAYKERRTELHTNPFGRLGTGGTLLFDVYPSPIRQLTYRRLIARNDQPLERGELAEQDRKYRERAMQARQELASSSDAERRRREQEAADRRARAQTRIDDVVATLQFTMAGQTMYKGTPAILIKFAPKRNAAPKTREGRIAQKFSGTVWVHEARAEVMRLEAKAIDDITFGFGIIARLDEGTTATVTREPVEGGLWLPTELTLTGHGRAALFRKLVLNHRIQWFDYRRLDGESATPFLDSRVDRQTNGGPE